MNNPFTLSFGTIQQVEIERNFADFDIYNDFNSDRSTSFAYIVTGVRGSGKRFIKAKRLM